MAAHITVKQPAATKPLGEEMEFFRQYNEVLFNKLEKKMLDLEADNQKLRILDEELRASEFRIKSISNNLPDGMIYQVIVKADGTRRFTYVSDSVKQLHGVSPEEAMADATRIYGRVHEDDVALFKKAENEALKALSTFKMEIRMNDPSGGIRWSSLSATPILMEDGSTCWDGIELIITEHKRAEEALRESEEKYRTIIEQMVDGYFEVDLVGNYTFVNDAESNIIGYSRDECIGMNNRQYQDEKNAQKTNQVFKRIYKTGEPIKSLEAEVIRKNGTKGFNEVSASLIKDAKGKPIGFRGFTRDVTGRKRAEEQLRQAEKNYRTVFENAQEGIYRATPEGRFIMANQAMARILGYDSPEELMEGITDIAHQIYVHPEERRNAIKLIERQGYAKNDELQWYRKDGSKIWVCRTMQVVLDENGQPLYADGIVEDITDRKESVDRLRKALGGTVRAIASLVETRDPYTAGHQNRVADLARTIAREMGLSGERIEGLRMAGIIHDIGKVSVPSEILSTPKRLTDLEFSLIKTHAQSGYDILKDIEFPWPVARMVLEHHERMNGSGYPNGLTGDNILVESRILSVADVVEAMATHRPYRSSLGLDAALEEITRNKGLLYDTDAVDACLRIFKEKGYKII
ncbi:MAG: HD-GYP domain-containing protein [Syntrophaceae bacterium]|nr:MAG: HD-GYP domain-containing protein [Syntrophaceae bacterium]